MPPLDAATGWLNSPALGPSDLRGRVVLVNFWTLTCINWLRTAPYVRAWSQAYGDDGLIVIGVHTPEFSFEQDPDLVQRAGKDRGIGYPVAADNDYRIWRAFDNHYWPALYFADRTGMIRDHHFGEGRYSESERRLQRLLGVTRELVEVQGQGVQAPADWAQLRTPETYLGYARGEQFGSPDDGALRRGQWRLTGDWQVGRESVALRRPGGRIAVRFEARDAHLVLSSDRREPIPFRVLLDGGAPGRSHGVDVDPEGAGRLAEGRMYQLVRQHGRVGERTLEIVFEEAGAEAYAFTFG